MKDLLTLKEAHAAGYSMHEIRALERLTNPDGSNRHFLKEATRYVGESMQKRYDREELRKAFAKRSEELFNAHIATKDVDRRSLGKRV